MTTTHPSGRRLSAGLAILGFLAWALLASGLAGPAAAGPLFGPGSASPPQPVEQSLGYLVEMVRDQRKTFEPGNVQALLEFVAYQADEGEEYVLDKRRGLNGAGLALDIRAPLERILRYVYNPAIPTYAMYPTVVRRSSWLPGSDILRQEVELWRMAQDLKGPVVLRGQEFEEITPDVSSGGYYSYDLDRLLILTPFDGKRAFISVSKQKGPSTVGRKGAVIDEGKDWTFVYTQEEGLTTGGIGWMDTFMYDSFSVALYVEVHPDRPLTRYGVFSWLKAGWAGIDVIKPKHIFDGCVRAGRELKRLMESSRLPKAEELAGTVQNIRSMSDAEMLRQLEPLSKALAEMSPSHPVLSKSGFADVLEKGRYAEKLSREERTSLLIKEYLKMMMGKPSFLNEPSGKSGESR